MPIGTIEVPVTGVMDEPTICIPVNVDWIPALLAMVSPARYPEFWAGTLAENRRARLEVQNLIYLISNGGLCDMSTCCIPPYIIKKIDPETGMIVISPDNGSTWQPAPGGLPTYIVEPVPPVTSGVASTQCDAANNVQAQLLGWITHVTNDFDTAVDIFAFGSAVIAAIADAVLLILSAGTLTLIEAEIITAIGAAITGAWLAGKTIFSNYWTDPIKAKILCAIYTHIGSDGAFTDAGFSDFWNDMNTNLPGAIAKMLFMGFLSSVGRQGLNAMAASGVSSGTDCSSVCPTCDLSNWTLNVGTLVSSDAVSWTVDAAFNGSAYVVSGQTPHVSPYDICCHVALAAVSGSPNFPFGQIDCGNDNANPANIIFPLGNTTAMNYFFIDSSAPFTAKLTFSE